MSDLKTITDNLNEAFEALRLAYMALLAAGSQAEEAGDRASMRFYDAKATRCRKALEGVGVLVPQKQRRTRSVAKASIGRRRQP